MYIIASNKEILESMNIECIETSFEVESECGFYDVQIKIVLLDGYLLN